MNLDTAIERFDTFLSAERGLSGNTLKAYMTDLGQFAAFLAARSSGSPGTEGIRLGDVRAFLRDQVKRGLSETSMLCKISSLRAFFPFSRESRTSPSIQRSTSLDRGGRIAFRR